MTTVNFWRVVNRKSTDFESDEFYPIKQVGGKIKPSSKYYAESKRTKENASQYPLTAPKQNNEQESVWSWLNREYELAGKNENTESKDCAPRQLTGDCKIRIRK
jgi:hypothetical protein